jgi:hypothetical protein
MGLVTRNANAGAGLAKNISYFDGSKKFLGPGFAGAGLVTDNLRAVARSFPRPRFCGGKTPRKPTVFRILPSRGNRCFPDPLPSPAPVRQKQKSRVAGFLFLVAGAGLAPATSRLCIPLRFSSLHRGAFVVWTIPFPCSYERGNLPSSLYTFLPKQTWLGIITLISEKTSPNLTDIPCAVSNA